MRYDDAQARLVTRTSNDGSLSVCPSSSSSSEESASVHSGVVGGASDVITHANIAGWTSSIYKQRSFERIPTVGIPVPDREFLLSTRCEHVAPNTEVFDGVSMRPKARHLCHRLHRACRYDTQRDEYCEPLTSSSLMRAERNPSSNPHTRIVSVYQATVVMRIFA